MQIASSLFSSVLLGLSLCGCRTADSGIIVSVRNGSNPSTFPPSLNSSSTNVSNASLFNITNSYHTYLRDKPMKIDPENMGEVHPDRVIQ